MSVLQGPSRVQIQTQSGCNARCVFCPNGEVLKSDLAQGRMPEALYQKIIDDLAETQPRRISLYLMNEPLLDRRLPDFVRYASERVPNASTLVTSNGTLLTESMAEALIDSGLKRLKVSLQSLDSKLNQEIMGKACDSEKVIQNVLRTRTIMRRKRARRFDLRVSMIVTNHNREEIDVAHRFWKKHGIRLVTSALENRGGNIADAKEMNPGEMRDRSHGCIRPSREMDILFNGDVVLCCVDWYRTVVFGNVAERHVREVWNNKRVNSIRHALDVNDRAAKPVICADCTESACPNNHRRGLKGVLKRLLPQSQA